MLLPTKRGSRCDWLLADIQICEYGVAAFSGNDQGIQVTNWKAWNPPIQQPCNSTLYHYQPCHHQHHCPHDSKMSKVTPFGRFIQFHSTHLERSITGSITSVKSLKFTSLSGACRGELMKSFGEPAGLGNRAWKGSNTVGLNQSG